MPLLQASNIGFQFDNGTGLFSDISLALNTGVVGLVGRNSVGKSILGTLLDKSIEPSEGEVMLVGRVESYSQLPAQILSKLTLAQYLGVDELLDVFDKIEQGSIDSAGRRGADQLRSR